MMPGWLSFMQLAPQRWRPISSSICIPSFARLSHTISCLCSTQLGRKKLPHHEEGAMQSTDLEEIRAALWEQASHPCTRVRWGVAQVMAVRSNKGQLLVLLRGRPRWHPVEAVTIERATLCPTGACDLEDAW